MDSTHISPGSRWQLRRGQHSGSVVEIDGETDAGTIKYHPFKKGRSVGSSSEDDKGRTHSKRREEFLVLYEPMNGARAVSAVSNGVATTTQPRFRQANTKKAPVQGGTPLAPLALGEVQVTLMTITPVLAEDWLGRGGVNRHLAQKRVDKLAAAIRRNEWQITGDTIKLDADGRVRDGQHRLKAIALAGIAVQTLVVRNVNETAFDVMDTGRSRSISDVLGIHGYKYTIGLAATIRNLMLFEGTGRFIVTTRESWDIVTTASAMDYIADHPDVQEAMKLADGVRLVLTGGIGTWAALLTLFGRINDATMLDFQDRLVTGEGLTRGSPILTLRNHLLQERREYFTRTDTEKEQFAGAVIKAWNAYRRDDHIESWNALVWHTEGKRVEPFPHPE